VSVEDRGPGYPRGSISQPFSCPSEGASARRRRSGWCRLGLSITQAIVEDHGGEVRLANRPVGAQSANASSALISVSLVAFPEEEEQLISLSNSPPSRQEPARDGD
jgi:signal transduction histidine kinase